MEFLCDIELKDSKITGLIIDPLPNDPPFVITDQGRIYFNTSTNTLRLNNGTSWNDISIPSNFSNLINTLGSNWITENLTFNPTAFDNFNNVTDLNANNSLFDVLAQLDSAISKINNNELQTLSDVVETTKLKEGNVVYWDGENFTFGDIVSILNSYSNLTTTDLKDIDSTGLADGMQYFYNAASKEFKAASLIYQHQDLENVVGHTITHNLNVQYCSVTLINAYTNQLITDATITYPTINEVDIVLQTAAPIYVILIAIPQFTI